MAAEVLLQHYPECVPCLYVLAETASTLLGFEEAVEASSRLLEVVPDNIYAFELHESNVEYMDRFKNAAKEQQENSLQLPDDRVHHRWAPITGLPDNHTALAHSKTTSDLQKMWQAVKSQEPTLTADIIEIMQRQWAVETGRVENLYLLSEAAAHSLIKHGISIDAITTDPARSMGIREGNEVIGRVIDIIVDQKKVIESISYRIEKQSANITKDLLLELQLKYNATARFT